MQVVRELIVHDREAFVDKRKALVYAVHCASNVAGAFTSQEAVEGNESFGFASGGIQERGAKHVHALDVNSWLCGPGLGPVCSGG